MKYPAATIQYADGGQALEVRQIYAWNRGEVTMVMSASSGPKDYFKNQICAVFDSRPEVNRIVLVRASGPPFALLRTNDNCWFDVTGKQVVSAASAARVTGLP